MVKNILMKMVYKLFSISINFTIFYTECSGYGIGFDRNGVFSHPSGRNERNVIVFGADMSSSTKIDNKGKDILILGISPMQGLGEHLLSAEKMYWINFTKVNTKFCFSLHHNGANSYLFVNGIEIYKFTAKNSMIIPNNLCLGNVSKDFSMSNMTKTGFNG